MREEQNLTLQVRSICLHEAEEQQQLWDADVLQITWSNTALY